VKAGLGEYPGPVFLLCGLVVVCERFLVDVWKGVGVRLRVGLTGGIGSGKSEVAKIFAVLGAAIVDADALAREAVAPGSAGLARIAALWPAVIDVDGALDREALGRVVFSDSGARDALNAIVHPEVRRLGAEREAAAGAEQIVIHDVPLLFEGLFYQQCDANVLVVADKETRIGRVVARSGLSAEDVKRRMAAQIDPDRARELADYTIDNDSTIDALVDAVREVYADLETRLPVVSRRNSAAAPE
jgi:dephospho-CoA kinase